MRKIKLQLLGCVLLWALGGNVVLGQTSRAHNILHKQEIELMDLYDQLLPSASEKVAASSSADVFSKRFFACLNNEPGSMTYPFKALQEHRSVYVASASDQRLRIYSWDQQIGGTMHFYGMIQQFKDGKQILTRQVPEI